jgi:uncharacterized protein YijF (DUF1287 family)
MSRYKYIKICEVLIMNDEAMKALRAEYYREWRKKNPDKVREINVRYWQRRTERLTQTKAPKEVQAGDTDN